MTHADKAKVQVGFGRVAYLWPLFAGDTVTKSFTVKSIRNTSDGHHSVRTIGHCYNSPNCILPFLFLLLLDISHYLRFDESAWSIVHAGGETNAL
jgi:hypothetical protein